MTKNRLFLLLITLASVCASMAAFSMGKRMKNLDPTQYFNGPQLTLAQAIKAQDVQSVKRLAKQTDLNTPAKKDLTILFFAFNEAQDKSDPKSFEIMTELVKSGADAVNYEVPDLGSVWGVSLTRSDARFVRALLDGGVNPNAPSQGKGSDPAIFAAATEKTMEVLQLLLSRGADINQKDSLGATVLQDTLSGMQLDQTEYLLKQGANPNTVDRIGVSFAWFLKRVSERTDLTPITVNKLSEIKALAMSKGMKWPPDPPEIERDRMRARGEKPVVPAGMSK
jgi:uncharacterized protein